MILENSTCVSYNSQFGPAARVGERKPYLLPIQKLHSSIALVHVGVKDHDFLNN